MPSIHRFAVRSSGRDLALVRRPLRHAPRIIAPRAAVVVEQPAVVLDDMLKTDLVSLAESRGVDSAGTKADILARLGSAQ